MQFVDNPFLIGQWLWLLFAINKYKLSLNVTDGHYRSPMNKEIVLYTISLMDKLWSSLTLHFCVFMFEWIKFNKYFLPWTLVGTTFV